MIELWCGVAPTASRQEAEILQAHSPDGVNFVIVQRVKPHSEWCAAAAATSRHRVGCLRYKSGGPGWAWRDPAIFKDPVSGTTKLFFSANSAATAAATVQQTDDCHLATRCLSCVMEFVATAAHRVVFRCYHDSMQGCIGVASVSAASIQVSKPAATAS